MKTFSSKPVSNYRKDFRDSNSTYKQHNQTPRNNNNANSQSSNNNTSSITTNASSRTPANKKSFNAFIR